MELKDKISANIYIHKQESKFLHIGTLKTVISA